jgi:TIR domain
MTRIFISYRRDDSAYIAGILRENLEKQFGKGSVFLDVESIPYGLDFRTRVNHAIEQSDLVLVIIGKSWLNITSPEGQRRIDSPTDYVRLEIEAALNRAINVIPVLVDNASMPLASQLPSTLQPLIYRNAAEIRPGRDLNYHIQQLVQDIEKQFNGSQADSPGNSTPEKARSTQNRHGISVKAKIATLALFFFVLGAIDAGLLPRTDLRVIRFGKATTFLLLFAAPIVFHHRAAISLKVRLALFCLFVFVTCSSFVMGWRSFIPQEKAMEFPSDLKTFALSSLLYVVLGTGAITLIDLVKKRLG